jgi:hypothetical protein
MSALQSEVDLPEAHERRRFVRDVVLPGAIAGTFGAVVAGLFAILTAAVLGYDPLMPLKLISGTIFHEIPLEQLKVGAALWGAFLLLSAGGGAGVTFSLLLPRGGSAMAGLFCAAGFGLVSYLGFVQLLLWIDPLLQHSLPQEALFPYVLLLGTCLGVVVPLRRLFARVARIAR